MYWQIAIQAFFMGWIVAALGNTQKVRLGPFLP
jgi:hypothetical protein